MHTAKKKRFDAEPILDFSGDCSHLIESALDNVHGFPVRTCILKRERKDKPSLLRFVLSPENKVVPDIKERLPGRGAWVSAKKVAVEDAVKRRAFQRAFKKPVSAEPTLALQVEELLKRSAIDYLSIANKAGLVVTGFAKVEAAIQRGQIVILLHASSAAADGVAKLDGKFAKSGINHIPPKNYLTSPEISLAMGSVNVIHAGLKEGGAAFSFLRALERFNDYCTDENA